MRDPAPPTCSLCSTSMQTSGVAPWSFRCGACGTWASRLPVRINEESQSLDEASREHGLRHLRDRNNLRILERLSGLGLAEGSTILDVGCAHAWFVEAASSHGFAATGLEPDDGMRLQAASRGVEVRAGTFPDALGETEMFDAITFNDVLEHLPDVSSALAAAHRHLRPGGLLSLNLPTSSGVVFRMATAAAQRGRLGTVHARLWQVGLPSPHVWYFDKGNLTRLCESHGFDRVYAGSLPSISVHGLWSRAHFDRRVSPLSVASVAAGFLAAPLLNRPALSDIMHLVFRARSTRLAQG